MKQRKWTPSSISRGAKDFCRLSIISRIEQLGVPSQLVAIEIDVIGKITKEPNNARCSRRSARELWHRFPSHRVAPLAADLFVICLKEIKQSRVSFLFTHISFRSLN